MERPDLSPAELMPAIVQDGASGRVLMLAWMDGEALRRTRESGEVWFWSRSRQQFWMCWQVGCPRVGFMISLRLVSEHLRRLCSCFADGWA